MNAFTHVPIENREEASASNLAAEFDDDALRHLYLTGCYEAFRSRGESLLMSPLPKEARKASIGLLYRALMLKDRRGKMSAGDEAAESEVKEAVGSIAQEIELALDLGDLDSEACSELAVSALLIGDAEKARQIAERSLQIEPVSAYAFFRIGTLEALEDHLEDAEKHLNEGLRRMPERAEAWANLAHVYERLGLADKARQAIMTGWSKRPAFRSIALKAIALLNESEGLADFRAEITRQLEALKPDDQEQRLALLIQSALLAEHLGEHAEMLARINEALQINEDDEELRHVYIEMMLGQERYWILGNKLKQWTEQYDVLFEHMALAECRIEAGFLDKAKEGLLAVKERNQGDPDWDLAWAKCLVEEGDYVGAKTILEATHDNFPEYIPVINQLADVYASLGEIEKSNTLTEKAADRAPGPLLRLLESKKSPTAADLARLEQWLDRIKDPDVISNIYFTKAHLEDRMENYPAAQESLRIANELVWKKLEYKAEDFTRTVDDIICGFDRYWIKDRQNVELQAIRPIFIVGMPRSGTTLLEQIFAAHYDVYGGGELPLMSRIRNLASRITGKEFPAAFLNASKSLIRDAAEYYVKEAKRTLGFTENLLVDKLPHNFMLAGLICAMFPNVRIIALRRDYRAIALSNYFQNFAAASGMLGYAYNLEAMGQHLADFERLMRHWKAELPTDNYREFHYEELVRDPIRLIPEVLEFCELKFTPELLKFYKNKTAVRTASVRQVRNPIYQGSVEKWRHYETMLQPVIDIVEKARHESI